MRNRSPERRSDPEALRLRGQIGAFALHAQHDPQETTKAARQAFAERFLRQVDPDGALPEEERERRAYYAKKAFFARLALARWRAHPAPRSARRVSDSEDIANAS